MKPPRSVPISYVFPGWLRVPVLPILVATEIRAIFPAWLFAVLTAAIASLLPGDERGLLTLTLGYGFGCAALGAIAAGHDFSHGTVGAILSLPVPRGRLWWTRLSVALAGMIFLALLVGMQIHFFRQPRLPTRDLIWALTIFFSPVLSGLLVAPWLTLLCRSLLAGIVFTASLPFLFLIMGEFAAQVRFGIGHGTSPETENFKAGVIGLMLLAHWVAGGYLGWRRFMRLEAIEGPIGELHLPRWLRSRSPTTSVALKPKRRHPLWQLLKKELRLQKIVFVTAGLFVVIVLTLWTIHQLRLDLDSAFVDITTVFFIGVVSMLIGAVASAEERQLGTAEWQVLLPMAARQQWAVKVATVLGLAVILAAFLPACVLDRVSWGNEVKAELPSLAIYFAGFAAALATIGLYFSSLCNSGLKAMLISLPAGVGIQWLIGIVRNHHDDGLQAHRAYFGPGPWDWLVTSLPPVLLVGLFLLTLRFAFSNHRSAERSVGRIWRQLGCLIAYVALSAALCYNVLFLYPAADRDNQEEAQSPPSL